MYGRMSLRLGERSELGVQDGSRRPTFPTNTLLEKSLQIYVCIEIKGTQPSLQTTNMDLDPAAARVSCIYDVKLKFIEAQSVHPINSPI